MESTVIQIGYLHILALSANPVCKYKPWSEETLLYT